MAYKLETVLYATDLKPEQLGACEYALALSHAFDAKLYVLHVIEPHLNLPAGVPGITDLPRLEPPAEEFQAAADEIQKRIEELWEEWPRRETTSRLRLSVHVFEGLHVDGILAMAQETHADTIVLGMRRRGFIRRILEEPISKRLLLDAGVPVALVPPPD